jgi:hypothetical protein
MTCEWSVGRVSSGLRLLSQIKICVTILPRFKWLRRTLYINTTGRHPLKEIEIYNVVACSEDDECQQEGKGHIL